MWFEYAQNDSLAFTDLSVELITSYSFNSPVHVVRGITEQTIISDASTTIVYRALLGKEWHDGAWPLNIAVR